MTGNSDMLMNGRKSVDIFGRDCLFHQIYDVDVGGLRGPSQLTSGMKKMSIKETFLVDFGCRERDCVMNVLSNVEVHAGKGYERI
jgi:hypothetical protein